jgi:hypothetical protein
MSSIPGPIISFRMGPEISGSIRPALDQIKREARTASAQIADEWKRMAAQIRATTAQGSGIEKEVLASRKELVTVLNREIDGLRTRNDLTRAQLSNLKAATLELERQQSFVRGGPGLTAGTMAVLGGIGGFLSKQTAFLGANLFGIAGGSQISSGISGALEGIGGAGAVAALGGLAAAAAGAAVAIRQLSVSGAEYVKNIEVVAQKTGIPIGQLQLLEAAGKRVNVSLDDLVVGFRKFSQALVGSTAAGEGGDVSGQAQKLSTILRDLGVNSKDPTEALKQLADAFQKLPDGPIKAATAVALLGRSGLTLIPILDQGRAGIEEFQSAINKFGVNVGPKAVRTSEEYEKATTRLSIAFQGLKVHAADEFLPGITKTVNFIAEKAIPSFERWSKSIALGFAGGFAAGKIGSDWTGSVGHFEAPAASTKNLADKLAHDLADGAEKANKKLDEYYLRLVKIPTLNERAVESLQQLARSFAGLPGGVYGPFNAPRELAPELSAAGGFDNILSPVIGPSRLDAITKAGDLLTQINKEHDDLFTTQREKDIQQYDKEQNDLVDALDKKLISQEQYNDAATKLQQDRNQTLLDADKKYTDEAGKLFDDIISGNGKKIGKAIEKDFLEAILTPVKKIFSEQFGGLLAGISRSVSGPAGGGATGSGGGILGGIFGPIIGLGGRIGPGGTAGWWPGQVGGGVSGAAGAPSVGVSAGQVGVATPVMNVHADIVNLSGSLALPGQGPLGSTTGNFFGNLNPFSNNALGGPIGLAGIPGGLSTGGLGGAISNLGPYIGAGALIGAGVASNNPTAMALGTASLARAGIGSLLSSGVINPAGSLGQALGTIAPALPGIGLFAGGVAQGGLGGTLEATAGGAMAGLALGGPIGAAIGAGVGLISGVVSTLIQGASFKQRVKKDMRLQQYTLPPSETFSFAMGNTIADTLATGFNQSGSHFGTYALPAGTPFSATPITGLLTRREQRQLLEEQMGLLSNQPFLGFPSEDPFAASGSRSQRIGPNRGGQRDGSVNFHITAIDSKGVADFLNEHGENISRFIASRGVYSSSSGFGSSVRRAANLP